MADILYPPARPQSVGEVLDTAFRIFRATVLKSLPYAALALIAGQLPNIYYLATGGVMALGSGTSKPMWWALWCVGYVIGLVLWSAVLLRQHAFATGRAADTGSAFATAVRRLPGLVLLWILIGAAVGICFLPLYAFAVPTRYVVGVLLLIPATYVGVALSAAWAALLLTGRGALASFAHSWRLTSGSFWRLSVIYTVAMVLVIVLYVLAGVIAAAISVSVAHGDVAVIAAISTVAVVVLGAVGTPFYCALALAVFGDLSARKEGTDLAQRISAPAAP